MTKNALLRGITSLSMTSLAAHAASPPATPLSDTRYWPDFPLVCEISTTILLILIVFGYWVYRLRQEVSARRHSEAELALLYTNMSLGFALHEVIRDDQQQIHDYCYLKTNPAFEKMTGTPRQQWSGISPKPVLSKSKADWLAHFAEVETTGLSQHFECYDATLDDWFEVDSYQVGANRFVLLLQNITRRKRDELALKASEERLRISQQYGGIDTWEYDLRHNRDSWEQLVNHDYGLPKTDNPTWTHFLATVCREDRPLVVEAMRKHLKRGAKYDVEYRINVSGKTCWMRTAGQAERNAQGKPTRMLGIVQDISERKLAEEKLHLSARVFSDAHEGIVITDLDALIINVNTAFCEITGYSREEVLGKNPRLLKSGRHNAEFYAELWHMLNSEGHWQGEIWNRKKSGELYAGLLTLSALRDRDGKIIHYIGLFSDITESKQQQQALEMLAHYDPLTKLPNRALFADRFNQAIAHSKRSEMLLAVCYLDLDGFKQVNDTFGHEVGDDLLIEVARRIKLNLREGDTVCRLGGDEFALLFENILSVQQCEDTLRRIHYALADCFVLNDRQIHIAASSGVTLYPLDPEQAETLLRHADQAMYRAKLAGRNCYRFYQPIQNTANLEQHLSFDRLEQATGEIRQALDRDQFCLHYQPQVNIATGDVVGAEALVRWQHPLRGLLQPADFMPLIEATPLEIELNQWVLRQVFRQLQHWLDDGFKLRISVNISPRFLLWPNFLALLETVLAEFPALASHQLQLEIREYSVLDDLISVSEILKQCVHRLGVSCALDDFGTSYAAPTHLRHLRLDSIKIDQSLVRTMLDDPEDQALVESVIGLAKAFKYTAIAEGVESLEHGEFLLQLGCKLAQGYVIARPMPADALLPWVKSYQNPASWHLQNQSPLRAWQTQLLLLQIQQRHGLNRLRTLLQSPGYATSNGFAPLSLQKSPLGKWLNRVCNPAQFDPLLLKQLEEDHRQQHRLSETVVHLHAEGKSAEAYHTFDALQKISQQIIGILQQLEALPEADGGFV